MTKSIFAGLAALLLLSACQKDESIAPDAQKLSIVMTSPQPGQIFRNGDTLRIRARVGYPGQLHGYEIRITDSASGSTLLSVPKHVHADSFDVNEDWAVVASQPVSVNVSLIATIDHDGNSGRKDVPVKLTP